jgi:hypothetical protein
MLLVTVRRHLRGASAHFKLCADFLDLRCLLFHTCGESFQSEPYGKRLNHRVKTLRRLAKKFEESIAIALVTENRLSRVASRKDGRWHLRTLWVTGVKSWGQI